MPTIYNTRFAVLDTETTGLDPKDSKVIQIAAYEVFQGKIRLLYSSLVNPLCPIPPETSAVHHITNKDVAFAPAFDKVWPVMKVIISGTDVLVAHNAPFDRSFLPETGKPWLCTRRLAQHLWPDAPNHKNQTLRYWLGIEVDAQAHDAMGDTLVTAHLLGKEIEAFLKQGGTDSADALLALADSPVFVSKMPFGKHRGKPLEDVPKDYLTWALTNMQDVDADLRASMEKLLFVPQ